MPSHDDVVILGAARTPIGRIGGALAEVPAVELGATAHGIGGALLEEFIYDDGGQLLTASFMDYPKPTALDVPDFEIAALESPSPVTPLGAKGVGEGGAIPSPAAIANAVEDALAPLGVRITSLPLTPARVWAAIQGRTWYAPEARA